MTTQLAASLEDIPGIDKALKTPIIDVEIPKLEAILENVVLTLVGEIETPCKHAMLVQIVTGRYKSNRGKIRGDEFFKN